MGPEEESALKMQGAHDAKETPIMLALDASSNTPAYWEGVYQTLAKDRIMDISDEQQTSYREMLERVKKIRDDVASGVQLMEHAVSDIQRQMNEFFVAEEELLQDTGEFTS